MPTEPAQLALATFEIFLLLSGAGLVLWLLANPAARTRWLKTNAMPFSPINGPDFALSAALIFLTGFAFQGVAQFALGPLITKSPDQLGLAVFAYSVANYSGALVAWFFLFPSLRRSWLGGNTIAIPPPRAEPVPKPRRTQALRYAAGTLMVALPLLSIISLAWTFVIERIGLPTDRQDVIAIFTNTRSPAVVAGMLLVACVLAPIYEELLFRAGLYRFCRQRLGRGWALVISGVCFGLLHGNWAGFLPLASLGMMLALTYEATGDIRVPIIAHGLFNLNTVLILLSGLQDLAQ